MNIEKLTKLDTFNSLKSFLSNQRAGRYQPLDNERWLRFIINSHCNNDLLNASELEEYIKKEWNDEEMAFDLSCDYTYGRQLLESYDKSKI